MLDHVLPLCHVLLYKTPVQEVNIGFKKIDQKIGFGELPLSPETL